MSEFLCQENPLINQSVKRLMVEPIRTTHTYGPSRDPHLEPSIFVGVKKKRKKSLVFIILFIEILLLEPSCTSAHTFSITQ